MRDVHSESCRSFSMVVETVTAVKDYKGSQRMGN